MTVPRNASGWSQAWANSGPPQEYITRPSEFFPFFARYLPRADSGPPVDFLELGCYPGRFLYLFAKEFGYSVHGVDFMPEAAAIPGWLADLGVAAEVFVEDLFTFQPGRTYDVVASFGFVEHFPRWEEVMDRHLALMAPGGYLVIEFPNFRRGQYYLRRLLKPDFLDGHFLEAMDLDQWRRALESRGLEILYCDYFQTFRIWSNLAGGALARWGRKLVFKVCKKIAKAIDRLRVNYPNKYFSPFAIIIARRGEGGVSSH